MDTTKAPEHAGNFNALLRLQVSAGDRALADHLENSPGNEKYVTDYAQNHFIRIAASIIRSKVIREVLGSGFFSVIADGTTDISKKEQFSIVRR